MGVRRYGNAPIRPLLRDGKAAAIGVAQAHAGHARHTPDLEHGEALTPQRMKGVRDYRRSQGLIAGQCSSM